jgi:hypothetical protein
MNVPEGNLIRRRVVTDFATPLSNALETSLTGYARLEPGDALLLDADDVGVITFEAGVPVVAYHAGTDTTGPAAISDIAVANISRVELYELDSELLAGIHDQQADRVPPGLPAEQLAGDSDLVERTRERAPASRCSEDDDSLAAVETFLENDERIDEIQQRARSQATDRADEWGFEVPD